MCTPNLCCPRASVGSEYAAPLRIPDCRLPRLRNCCLESSESRCSKLWAQLRHQEICFPQCVFPPCFVLGRQGGWVKLSVPALRKQAMRPRLGTRGGLHETVGWNSGETFRNSHF